MDYEQIASNIKFFREQKKWTQKELAEGMNISRSVIAKWESGISTPDIKSLVVLSKTFGISIDQIIGLQTVTGDFLKEVRQSYGDEKEEFTELFDYLMKQPLLKEQLLRIKDLPLKKQRATHKLVKNLVDELNRM